jgi:hypothetical protein
VVREVPDSVSVPLPAALEPVPVYGMAVLSPNPDAARFALFTLSPRGQAILAKHELLPVLSGNAGGISILTPSNQPAVMSGSDLHALPSATLNADAGVQAQYSGPTLWSGNRSLPPRLSPHGAGGGGRLRGKKRGLRFRANRILRFGCPGQETLT